ncbi:DUF58 domain-containing protein [Candidatus Bipolaricaulota bacterium]|nr:DUF58 domain-containing protein [Candidatus Bipolaricaulota bacterium]
MGRAPGGPADRAPSLGLLSPEELWALSRTRLSLRRAQSLRPGGHLSRRAGTSLEFADHRPYQPGDDLRLIDWVVYARHRRLVTKVFSREVEAPLYILLDCSASMGLGGKLLFAKKLAAALVFLAFRSGDRFGLYPFSAELQSFGRPRRGRSSLVRVFQVLVELSPAGRTDLARALGTWSERTLEPGLCLVLSDFLAPGLRQGLLALRYGRHAVAAVQILSPEDLSPPILGEVRLLDAEEGRGKPAVVGPAARRAYQENLRRWNKELAQTCEELGVAMFFFVSDGSPVAAALTLARRWRP